MFIFPRSALAVIAALVVAWLLPQLVARWINDEPPVAEAGDRLESRDLRFAKGE
ncbi:MAG TPA: hypothetical protein VLT59_12480 [Steroidobacteraceae bacterium]|nr:hypothetical protein [Steroidobacteraceae bacterium]